MRNKFRPNNKVYDSNFEENFHKLWKQHSSYPIVFHHTVCCPNTLDPSKSRKWELDFCFPAEKLGIELQGHGTGHLSYKGMRRDCEKHNDLVSNGWTLLYFMTIHLNECPDSVISLIIQRLEHKNERIRCHTNVTSRSVHTDLSKEGGQIKSSRLADLQRRLSNQRPDR